MLSITERIKRYEDMGYNNDEAYNKVIQEEEWAKEDDREAALDYKDGYGL